MSREEGFGVYVHFPYCRAKCPYCDFAVHVVPRIPHLGYADAVLEELRLRAVDFERFGPLRSIFFGGGTPSLWEPAQLSRVRSAIEARFPGADREITLEVNPEDLDREGFRRFAGAGINRASLGVQSFDDDVLRDLGRAHSGDRARRAIADALAAGFASVSIDLIFGGPGQTPALAAADAEAAAALGVQHVSAYGLTLDELAVDVPLAKLARAGQVHVADADGQAELGLALRAVLAARGYVRYEISNFALAGHQSRHNLGYWAGMPYLGLGVGAYGATAQLRYGNPRGLNPYFDALAAHRLPEGERDPLDEAARFRERVFLGLRRTAGLDLAALAGDFGADRAAAVRAAALPLLASSAPLAILEGVMLRLTERGLDLHSEVCARLV